MLSISSVAPVFSPSGVDPGALPDVWRASELGRSRTPAISTGHGVLDNELPNGGWPQSSLTELLLLQHGIGELQLLQPVLARLARNQRIALVQPPCIPQAMAARHWCVDPLNLLWLRPTSSADALWAAEQILKNGSCGAVLLWQNNIRAESLRRLHLAAQGSEIWFWLLRPMAAALEASPAPLRLGVRPAHGGAIVEILKRRGPTSDDHLFISLPHMPVRRPITESDHAIAVQSLPTTAATPSAAPLLV